MKTKLLILALISAFVLSSCGNTDSSAETVPTTTTTTSTDAGTTTTTSTSAGTTATTSTSAGTTAPEEDPSSVEESSAPDVSEGDMTEEMTTTTKAVETTTQQTTTSKPVVTTKVTTNKPATTTTTKKTVTSVNDQTCNHVWCSDAEAAIYTIDGITYKTVVCVKCQMTHTEVVKNTSKTTTKTTTVSKTIPTNAWIPVYYKTIVSHCVDSGGYDKVTGERVHFISPTYWDVKALSRGEAKAQADYKKANDEALAWSYTVNCGGWTQGGNDHTINTPDKSSIAFWYYRDSNGKLAVQFPIRPNQLYSGIKTESDLKTYGCYDNVSSIGKTGLEYANVYYTGTPWEGKF